MRKAYLIFLSLLCIGIVAAAQDETSEKNVSPEGIEGGTYELITNVGARKTTDLCGDWDAIVDQYENGYLNYRMKPMKASSTFFADRHYYQSPTKRDEYDFDCADTLTVPGDWNTQNVKLYYYEGTIWYRKVFDCTPRPGKRYFLHFCAVNYEAVCGLNGQILGRHVGGFTPFDFEVTDILKSGSNSLVVKVNNSRHKDAVPTNNCDWWNYGGITREVRIIETPETFIRDYCVGLSTDGKHIDGWVQLDGSSAEGSEVTVAIPELRYKVKAVADANGMARFSKKAKPQLWCPETPKLYDVTLSCGDDALSDRIGFKTISADGSKLLLNGSPVFCKGIAIHEETMDAVSGRAWSREQSLKLLMTAKELGCNFVRLAHYPHNENMTRLADSLGLMVWSEIPVYWTISWENPDTYRNAANQLEEMITRDRNRASIIIWSIANETPKSEARLRFLSSLIDRAKELDATRLVGAAMEKTRLPDRTYTVKDELQDKTDVISFNQYLGWYDGKPEKCLRAKWSFSVDKPVIITELGAGVKYGYHAGADVYFSEEYGVELYKAQIKMLSEIPGLAGLSPWILKDFRSPRRQLKGIQDDFNRKGLVSERGEKKDVFYVLQHWYKTNLYSLAPSVYTVKGDEGKDIQAQIDKAFSDGGGKVVVPSGTYRVGSIRLRSNVELHLDKGAVLLGGDRSGDYDSFPDSVCSIKPENSSKVLVYAYGEHNIALTGEGVIDGQGPKFFDTTKFENKYYAKPPVERPRMVQLYDCDGIRLEGVTFKDSPCWTMFIRLCRNIEVDGITVTADQNMINNDGIDFDGCTHVRVRNSRFKTCDDCLILRAMRENPQDHIVCEDIEVSDCDLDSRCQTVRLGCPSDDVIRHACFKNITARGNNGIFADYPTRYLRSDDTGYMDISDIVFENYSGTFSGRAVQIVSQPGVKVRRVDGIVFRNFDVRSGRALRFIGNKGCEIGTVLLENFKARIDAPGDPMVVRGCNGLTLKGVTLNGENRPDGPVAGDPGDDSPLVRGKSKSWEAKPNNF